MKEISNIKIKQTINELYDILYNNIFDNIIYKIPNRMKDNYLNDYFNFNIKKDIKLIYSGMKEIDDFVKSVIMVYERFNLLEERVRKLKMFVEWMEPLFESIRA